MSSANVWGFPTEENAVASGIIPNEQARSEYINANYTKTAYEIPMRDGEKLFTHVYSPLNTKVDNPIILIRTPYGIRPYGEEMRAPNLGPSWHFVKENYIIVYQDVRGRYMSDGTFAMMRPVIQQKQSNTDVDEASDTCDTIDWLINNIEDNNGKVGVQGISYPGFYAAMSLVESHPALKAVSPQAPMADLFMGDDGHHYGALYLNHTFSFFATMGLPRKEKNNGGLNRFGYPTQDNYDYLLKLGPIKNIDKLFHKGTNPWWTQVMEHETYDQFWKDRSIYHNLKNIKPAVLVVGGWYDAEDLLGTIQTYKHIEKQNQGIQNTFVMGPWTHGQWSRTGNTSLGLIDYEGNHGEFFQEKVQLEFFNHYLKGNTDESTPDIPEAVIFETGSNKWRFYDQWPIANGTERKFYLDDGGTLSFQKPDKSALDYDEYVSDPAKPVPYTAQIGTRLPTEYMVEDQRFASRRPDVLTYQSEVLSQGVTMSGPITVDFHVSTSGTDADWVVKVIDVYPDDAKNPENIPRGSTMGGYQMMVRGDIIRGKFRNSFENPEPFEPNKVTRVKFELPDVQHKFKEGHKIMIQVQSSWFPLMDRNPQSFVHVYKADEKDFVKATQRIFHTDEYPSNITVMTVDN
ncbi:MAG: CocE/NonD family hydrolase [Kordiimonadaceae bacterium]|nr:CocE/NonD family hydrolase [Kordiimonadaceae bacterium]